ncbi:homoserine kinase [Starmerella bacillaris]|uniref:Homoserine kinase n=1 Tax=Starmerella bacillaris TaxID=1247836 RepID=A0AAV5RH12_STABA|nr:homoserine kinase [Starmerella bacillaris]
MREFTITVPASSANIGPGFDVLGIALSLYLTLKVTVDRDAPCAPLNCVIKATGEGCEEVPLEPETNLITRTALYVLRAHDVRMFPVGTHVHVHNDIPLGRGLGSSGAAVVAGVMLGNALGNLNLSKRRIMDFCLMIERHPDNIAASLYGGFIGSILRDLSPSEAERVEVPLAEVLPLPNQNSGGIDTGLRPPTPPVDFARSIEYRLSPNVKAVCVIPNFEVSTAKARDVLPTAYTRQDAIKNLQCLSMLIPSLGVENPDPELVFSAMQDTFHQRYRRVLVPGLADILATMSPRTNPGLLGVCLSGAGPTVLALATENFEDIAADMISEFKKNGVSCTWKLLEPATGANIDEA